jgi:hypothetical protein
MKLMLLCIKLEGVDGTFVHVGWLRSYVITNASCLNSILWYTVDRACV